MLNEFLCVLFRRDNGLPAGYCFVEFRTEDEAERVLKTINGKDIPGTNPVRKRVSVVLQMVFNL